MASALDAAHARGLIHRDVKPSNVLLDSGGGADGTDHAYLADFGLTTRQSDGPWAQSDGALLGTIDYVAPEQIAGDDVDGRADVYSLTCVLYECVAGHPPFRRASEVAAVFAQLHEEPPALSAWRPDLRALDAPLAKGPREAARGALRPPAGNSPRRPWRQPWTRRPARSATSRAVRRPVGAT